MGKNVVSYSVEVVWICTSIYMLVKSVQIDPAVYMYFTQWSFVLQCGVLIASILAELFGKRCTFVQSTLLPTSLVVAIGVSITFTAISVLNPHTVLKVNGVDTPCFGCRDVQTLGWISLANEILHTLPIFVLTLTCLARCGHIREWMAVRQRTETVHALYVFVYSIFFIELYDAAFDCVSVYGLSSGDRWLFASIFAFTVYISSFAVLNYVLCKS